MLKDIGKPKKVCERRKNKTCLVSKMKSCFNRIKRYVTYILTRRTGVNEDYFREHGCNQY